LEMHLFRAEIGDRCQTEDHDPHEERNSIHRI
jgi:hypothetical protein